MNIESNLTDNWIDKILIADWSRYGEGRPNRQPRQPLEANDLPRDAFYDIHHCVLSFPEVSGWMNVGLWTKPTNISVEKTNGMKFQKNWVASNENLACIVGLLGNIEKKRVLGMKIVVHHCIHQGMEYSFQFRICIVVRYSKHQR
jgi:hypothetical protein